ncbi:TetR/AcrR family transcriptional regulator [Streptomyces sp. ME02-8801-2C]|uniref:TetR/AcrR family transcriptional regulator n=1 Tax=Streptomyces sp. ME02-8801-2C TaxID=3028680 RepID=UPI0029A37E03|nr:TetR/AcrR family transcriptional regulator [Streptomyces sp. ME02-8801-2C]MDX3458724.1 TetR/AcrR family transcriptional regulator [Streptomyces sp. ME02-8801-2C]
MVAPSAHPKRRADAERNIARVVSAARTLLSSDPNATTDDIAQAAGVGRMTLYGHFRTRADLVEAALKEALRAGEETLASVDLTGDASAAMSRLLASSWQLTAESAALLAAAGDVLPPGRVRELHDEPARRVDQLIRRGQEQGVFRTDLPTAWLVSAVHYILDGAAKEVRAGRLDARDAADAVTKSVQSVLTG